jgi:alkane 1-monooxygenase
MILFSIVQLAFVAAVFFLFGTEVTAWLTLSAISGILLLETVNYIEHYGLQRRKVSPNRYENATPEHSWNSNHAIGRMVLFELSRHSDHHYMPSKKYQILDHHDHSPQLPTGYPGMMLLSFIPPLWCAVMNHRLRLYHQARHNQGE